MNENSSHQETVARAALPEVMFAPDIALAMRLSVEAVEAQAPDGCFGPCFYVEGRVAVLRRDFLPAMAARAARRNHEGKEVLGLRACGPTHSSRERGVPRVTP